MFAKLVSALALPSGLADMKQEQNRPKRAPYRGLYGIQAVSS